MGFKFNIGNFNMSFGKQSDKPTIPPTKSPNYKTVDYVYAPLRTALLPTPAELRYALNYVDQDPRDMLDIIRKLPQASLHLMGLIGKRQDAFLSLDYEVSPHPLNAKNKEEIRRCDEINNLLAKSNFDTALKQIVNGVIYGHSVTQPHWQLDGRNFYYPNFESIDFIHFTKQNGTLKMIADKGDKDFLVTIGDNANITGSIDKNSLARMIKGSGRLLFLDLDPEQLIVCNTNPFEGLQKDYLGGWMRPMLYLTLLLHYDVLDWAKFNELYGMPVRVGKYDSYSPDKAIEVLKTAVQNLGTDASAVIDKSTEIEFIESKRNGGDGYAKFAEYVESKQSVNLRGETLTTEVTSKGGNRALGTVHMQVGMDKLLGDIKASIPATKQIVEKMYRYNFGNPINDLLPRSTIYPKDMKDYDTMLSVYRELSSTGLEMSKARVFDEFKEFIEPPQGKEDVFTGKANPFGMM